MRTTGVVGVGRSTLWGAGAVAVLVLGGCGAADDAEGPGAGPGETSSDAPSPAGAPSSLEPAGRDPDRACTLIGFSGGIYIDLAAVLDADGGPYFAEVSAQGSHRVTSVPVRPDRDSTAYLDPALENGAVVAVDVVVRSGEQDSGPVVWTESGSGTPTLHQPNGPGCGDVYTLGLAATPGGGLVLDPDARVGGGDPDQGFGGEDGQELLNNELIATFQALAPPAGRDFNQGLQVPLPPGSDGAVRVLAIAEFLDPSGAPSSASAVVATAQDGTVVMQRVDAPLTATTNSAVLAGAVPYEGADAAELAATAQRTVDEMDDIYS